MENQRIRTAHPRRLTGWACLCFVYCLRHQVSRTGIGYNDRVLTKMIGPLLNAAYVRVIAVEGDSSHRVTGLIPIHFR